MEQTNAISSVLVVEDDRFIGEMYVRSLRRVGLTVDWVMTGNEAIQVATSKAYDLILLDVMLPEKQGTEVLTQLRNADHDDIPHSRVIVLTNFDQDEESRAAMLARADGYFIKADITPKKLIDIIQNMEKIS